MAFVRAALADPEERPTGGDGEEGEVWKGRCFFMDAQTARCIYFSPRSTCPRQPSGSRFLSHTTRSKGVSQVRVLGTQRAWFKV